MTKSISYLLLLVLVVVAAIGINEMGYGIFSLLLLFPAVLLMTGLFEEKPSV